MRLGKHLAGSTGIGKDARKLSKRIKQEAAGNSETQQCLSHPGGIQVLFAMLGAPKGCHFTIKSNALNLINLE